jgi:hypothetical protein
LVDWVGELANRSPNWARLRLKPVEPTLARLLEIAPRSVCAALRPRGRCRRTWSFLSQIEAGGFVPGPRLLPDVGEERGLGADLVGDRPQGVVHLADPGEA